MLAKTHRLTRHRDFSAVLRRGRRAGRMRVVVHVLTAAQSSVADLPDQQPAGTRVGLVVSKTVGPAVVRHRVARRLRHVARPLIDQLPDGTDVVLRALSPAAVASSAELAADVRSALRRLGLLSTSAPA